MSRTKNPKYESMSLEELKANMEKSRQELEVALHNKNQLEQRKKLVERRECSHRLIVKGAEVESKSGVVFTEILISEYVPECLTDRDFPYRVPSARSVIRFCRSG